MRTDAKKKGKKRRKRLLAPYMRFVIVLVMVSCAGILANSYRIYRKVRQQEAVRQEMQARIEKEKQEQEDLKAQVSDMGSDEYIKQQAREKLGLVFDNEIIFKKKN